MKSVKNLQTHLPLMDMMSSVALDPAIAGGTDKCSPVRRNAADVLPVTFVILTKNEERNLGACLDSIEAFADDIHVLDSGSDDGTAAIAESRGIAVHVHPFRGFGSQRNWAIDHIPHGYEWVFHLDADERVTPELAAEIRRRVASDPSESGFFVPHKLMFLGSWLRRAGGYPTYQVRLFHRERLRFIDYGHGQREITDGSLGFLTEPYLHDAFSKGLDDWLKKHAGYAIHEAEQFHAGRGANAASDLKSLISSDRIRRRRALKNLSYRLPFRASLRFGEMLILKGAILDGRPGITYAKMLAAYEAMIAAHISALRCGFAAEETADSSKKDQRLIERRRTPPRRPR